MPATTPNNPSKQKEIVKLNKTELIEEVNFHRHNEVVLKDCIEQLWKEIRKIRDELKNTRRERNSREIFMDRAIEIEKRLADRNNT